MKFPYRVLPLILFASCASPPPARPVTETVKPVIVSPAPPAIITPSLPVSPLRVVSREIDGIQFYGVEFDSRSHRLAVVDQADGPGSLFPDASSAARSKNAVAAVNAGFFTPEGKPLGLVISAGKSAGAWNPASSLGSGIWFQNSAGEMEITRREKLGRTAASATRELIQAGPLLVENGREISGLEATKSSVRIVILSDGGNRWWLGRLSPCTLAAASSVLARHQPIGWKISQALNLDGGRSADLWISSAVPGGPLERRSPWNRPVRNFLLLLPK